MDRKSTKKPQQCVHFDGRLSEHHVSGDTDIDSEIDKGDSKTSSALKSGGDMHSASSISTSILDDEEEVKQLKAQLEQADNKCKLLEMDIHKANISLHSERNKNVKLEKKLQFVKDNQEVFMRLKEAYINMKYNEAAGRKMIEVREKGMQTWEGILCRGCIESEEIRRQVEALRVTYKDAYVLSSHDTDRLIHTVKYLKDMIEKREQTWVETVQRENNLYSHISMLENENIALKNILANKGLLNEKQEAELMVNDVATNNAEVGQLKKIIVKFEKCFREAEKQNEGYQYLPLLNDREKRIVQQIMTRYYTAKNNKERTSRSASRDRKKKMECKTSSISKIPVQSEGNNTNSDLAMVMMDYLFEDQ